MVLSRLLRPEELAELLNTTPEVLAVWRCTKAVEIPYVKLGRAIRYREDAVEEFLKLNTVHPTPKP